MFITLSRIKLTIIGTQIVMAIPVKVTNIAIVQYVAIFLFKGFLLQSWFLFMIFNFNKVFLLWFFFTYTSSKLEVLNNNDYCSKSVASSLRFSIQFFKTQLKIPRNRCATFSKRVGDTYKHLLHCTVAVFVWYCPKNMRIFILLKTTKGTGEAATYRIPFCHFFLDTFAIKIMQKKPSWHNSCPWGTSKK